MGLEKLTPCISFMFGHLLRHPESVSQACLNYLKFSFIISSEKFKKTTTFFEENSNKEPKIY